MTMRCKRCWMPFTDKKRFKEHVKHHCTAEEKECFTDELLIERYNQAQAEETIKTFWDSNDG